MKQKDKKAFAKLFGNLCEYYNKNNLSTDVLRMYFGGLNKFTIEQIVKAASDHMHDASEGRFFPLVCHFERHLGAQSINYESIIAYALSPKCPLGALVRIRIGTWNLKNLSQNKLKMLAIECLASMSEWQKKAGDGSYTDHELRIMIKYKIDPSLPLAPGLDAPAESIKLKERYIALCDSS